MHELIYAGLDVEEIVKKRYPEAKLKDASDFIHTERFEAEIDTTEDDFYPFAIKEGFAGVCLGFNLLLGSLKFPELKGKPNHKDTAEKIHKWIDLSKKE